MPSGLPRGFRGGGDYRGIRYLHSPARLPLYSGTLFTSTGRQS
ncbi:hypothetical protein DCCM_2241 [Desulfocucumis palustris]|uniref:Uncharacterized protein n=1 Tax=Desulfocucumis palustris TaxID=1898651 RepID=A0A2L2XAY6_9FIRM|nr:hypothetical protein DCCM_2241 [Desulfocucumis palustris]